MAANTLSASVELTPDLLDAVQYVLRRLELFPSSERDAILVGFNGMLDAFEEGDDDGR